jgi:hypothetical protein
VKRRNRVEAARVEEVAPVVVESVTTTRTQKIVPLAQSAAERVVPLAQGVAAKAGPLAAGYAAAAGPLAHQVYEKAAPLAGQAVHAVAERVTPYTELAANRIAPVMAGGAAAAHEAAERVGPAWESARDRVSDDLLPRISTTLSAAAASPFAVEAVKRGRATAAAARGELTLPEEKPSGGSWVKRIAIVTALAGVAAVVLRRLLDSSQDSGWQAARPSAPAPSSFTSSPSSAPAAPAPAPAPAEDTFGTAESDTASTDPQSGQNAHAAMAEADGQPEPDQPAEGGDEAAAPDSTGSRYGEGSYVGSEPPEGFVIKGNETSMRYHLPDGSGYEETRTEVWFDGEDAAERAGFSRAQS